MTPCDHCERIFPILVLHPVIVTGVQSYNGHLLTGKPEARRVPLCDDCYVNFKNASIQGMSVVDDEEAMEILTAMPELAAAFGDDDASEG